MNKSPFYQATQISNQLKQIEQNENVDNLIERAEKIAGAMNLNLDYIYNSLNDALDMIDVPDARGIIEDVRDEVYRCMR